VRTLSTKIVLVDQSPLADAGSNPVTYTKAFDAFAISMRRFQIAKKKGLTPGHFLVQHPG